MEPGKVADIFTRRKRSAIMSRIRSMDTAPEKRLQAAFRSRGLRFHKHYGPYKIDVAFIGKKVAVFLDSCFWHACPEHGEVPKTNREFWSLKLKRNRYRDQRATRDLELSGWIVLRFWGHETDRNLEAVVSKIVEVLASSSARRPRS